MTRGVLISFGMMTAIGLGLILSLSSFLKAPETISTHTGPDDSGDARSAARIIIEEPEGTRPSAPRHHNIHGLTVYPLDSSSLQQNTTIVEFGLRRKTVLSLYALGSDRRRAFTLYEAVKLNRGTHRIPAARIVAKRGALREGSYFLEFADRSTGDRKDIYNPLKFIEWKPFPQSRIRVSDSWSRIQYKLDEPSLVRLRICTPSGFVLDTEVNGEFREAGLHVERWRRRDPTGRVVFPKDIAYAVTMDVARPPVNHLHIDLENPAGSVPKLDPRIGRNLPGAGEEMRHGKSPKPVPPLNTRSDFACLLDLEDWKLVEGKVRREASFKIDKYSEDEDGEGAEAFSLKIYLDLNQVHGEKNIHVPYSHERRFDKEREGVHVLSVMIEDSKGNVGISSIPFEVDHGSGKE